MRVNKIPVIPVYIGMTVVLVILLFFSNNLFAKKIVSPEKALQKSIHQQMIPALKLLKKLVNINSGTTNTKGVHKVGELLRPEFKALGFKTYWVAEPASFHRAGTLYAVRKGSIGKRILLIAHLDTVFAKNSPFQHYTRKGNIATGPGVIDDKGGIIVILYALKALNAIHALDNTSITVAMMGDEEDSGKPASISRKSLFAVAKKSDVALDFECSLGLDTATIARRGVSRFMIMTKGSATHSAQIFKDGGFGANLELARILTTAATTLAKQKYISFNPAIMLGGAMVNYNRNSVTGTVSAKTNIIAKTAIADGDLRFISPEQQFKVEQEIKDIVKNHLPGTNAAVIFQDGIPAMEPTENNLKLLKLYSKISQELGYGKVVPLDPAARGAGDISYIAYSVPANLAGLGPLGAGGGAHSLDEGLTISSLPVVTTRAAVLIYQLLSN